MSASVILDDRPKARPEPSVGARGPCVSEAPHQLAFDFAAPRRDHRATVRRARSGRGRIADLSGASAEDQVSRHYADRGADRLAARWRCQSGEIDLIFRGSGTVIFVEVKRGATHARAAERLSRAQGRRITLAAEEFLSSQPAGALTDVRFDVALVDGTGRIEIVENALL